MLYLGSEERLRIAMSQMFAGATIAEVFKGKVSSDAEANQGYVPVRTCSMLDDATEVFPGTAVVGAKQLVHLPAAATKIPGQCVPSGPMKGSCHSLHRGIGRVTLKAVRDDDERVRVVASVPIKIQKIPVMGRDALPLAGDRFHSPEEHGQNRLEMPIAQPPWRSVGRGCNQGHG